MRSQQERLEGEGVDFSGVVRGIRQRLAQTYPSENSSTAALTVSCIQTV